MDSTNQNQAHIVEGRGNKDPTKEVILVFMGERKREGRNKKR